MVIAPLDLIRKRRADIQEVIADLGARIDRLREELAELEVAERVMSRLGSEERSDEQTEDESATINKPSGIPTMPEMILEALRSDTAIFGLEPKALVKFIADKWWPDVRPELVGPIAWRMWKRGDLVKEGTHYCLPLKNEAAGTPSEDAPTASDNELFK
jgi:hypothetical protein